MRLGLRLTIVLAAVGFSVASARAQTEVPGSTGLGKPLPPLDARARALGGATAALHGPNLSAVNPASLTQLGGSGFWATIVPEKRSVEGDVTGDLRSSDLPLARLAAPLGGSWNVSLTFGGFLDQDFGVQFVDTLRFSTGDVAFEETRSADGGISQFRLDLGGEILRSLSVGLAGIFYTGEVRQQVDRAFAAEAEFTPYRSTAAIQYRGWGLAAGTQVQPIPEIILGLAASWGPGLNVENDSTGEELDLDLPVLVDVGGSLQLTPGLLVALSAGWGGWSALTEDVTETGGSDTWRLGLGFEARVSSGSNSALFARAGAQWERLPFEIQGGAPSERALSLGLGALLRGGRGRLDGTVELGRRGDENTHGVEETFTRVTLSLGIFTR